MADPTPVQTRVLSGSDDAALVAEVAGVLRSGGVVLLPTETVYGLVGRSDKPEVIERIRRIKGRDRKPFARLVPDLAAVDTDVPPAARTLAERYWPGPLTLVLDAPAGSDEPTWGFRVPGLEFARRVVQEAGVPLSATSANRTGELPAKTFAEAAELVGEVDLAVDGGASQLGAASTVVRVSADAAPEVLREGFLGAAAIERLINRTVIFVCTGNTCRSPMAQVLFEQKLADAIGCRIDELPAYGWFVASAGVAAGWNGPAAGNAVIAMNERGLDLTAHASQPLSDQLLEAAELVVTLTPGHLRSVLSQWPEWSDKVRVLDPMGVPDPVGGSLDVYRECAMHIDSRLDDVVNSLGVEQAPAGSAGSGASAVTDFASIFPAAGEVPPDYELTNYPDGNTWLVNGEVRRWKGATEPVHAVICDRAPDGSLTRRVIGETAMLTSDAATEALEAATRAWDRGKGAWPRAALPERIERIAAFANAMREAREEVVRLLMWEIGKSLPSAQKEFDRTVEYIDDTLAALKQVDGEECGLRSEGGVLAQIRRAPLGVTLCMGPFNYPLNETYTTVIPALVMGNTCVVKLPKLGMLCNLPLLDAFAKTLPPGVINFVSGDGATVVGPIIKSGKIDALAFIGSSKVAGIIEKQHPAPYRLTTILGMEAKNPAIVLPCADLDVAVKACLQGSLSYNGQRCTALKLLFVHRSLADEFVERFAESVEALPFGMPWEEGVSLTPLPEPEKAQWLASLVEDAVTKGAEVKNPRGGKWAGTFFFPAVVYPVSPGAKLYDTEQFGPIVPIVPFDDVNEVYDHIASSEYGQQVSIFGQDPDAIGPLVDSLANQVCRINLNRQCQRGPDVFPFGGRKNSAEGVLSVTDALEAFSLPTIVAAGDPDGRGLVEAILDKGTSTFLRKA